jgi:hypothetical protein
MEDKFWQIIIGDFAEIDLQQAFDWYEFEKNVLGNLF